VFFFDKGAAYYFANVFFLGKLGLFVDVGLLSIYPTLMFRRDRLSSAQAARVKLFLRLQLAGVVLILLCAALMAKGAGFFG
jgi:putative membrane protein